MLLSNHPLSLYETMHPYLLEGEKSCENDGKGVALDGGVFEQKKGSSVIAMNQKVVLVTTLPKGQWDDLKDYSPKETREDWKRVMHLPERGSLETFKIKNKI